MVGVTGSSLKHSTARPPNRTRYLGGIAAAVERSGGAGLCCARSGLDAGAPTLDHVARTGREHQLTAAGPVSAMASVASLTTDSRCPCRRAERSGARATARPFRPGSPAR